MSTRSPEPILDSVIATLFSDRAVRVALLLLALVVVSGCGDRYTNGPVSLSSPETLAAFDFGGDLPSLPGLAARTSDPRALDGPVEEWRATWTLPEPQGRRARARIHRTLAPVLLEDLSTEDLEREMDALDEAVKGVETAVGAATPLHLLPSLVRARTARDRAAAALDEGERNEALVHLLDGFDGLRSATPAVLARELLEEGAVAFERLDENGDPDDLRRAERLLLGAEEALDRGAGVLALRRAWYAARLLNASGQAANASLRGEQDERNERPRQHPDGG